MENENKEIIDTQEQETNEVNDLELVEPQQEQSESETIEEEYVGKEVTTSIRYDYKTMKYFNMYNAGYRRKLPIIYIVFGIVTLVLGAYSFISALMESNENPDTNMTGSYIILALFAFFAFYFFKQGITFESFVDKQIRNHFAMNKVAKQNIKIREDKITLIPVDKPEESFSYDWVQITSIEEIDEYFFLFIGKQPLIIDKDPNMMVEGTYEQMLEIFDEQIAVKPYKRCNKKIVKKPIDYIHQDDLENDENAVEVEVVDSSEEKND